MSDLLHDDAAEANPSGVANRPNSTSLFNGRQENKKRRRGGHEHKRCIQLLHDIESTSTFSSYFNVLFFNRFPGTDFI
jgi:hypothetical protein